MRVVFSLSTCQTCRRILTETKSERVCRVQDIKSSPITAEQLDHLARLAGSYEALFSKRSMKYRAWNLKEKALTEEDMRDLMLKEYTFIKRPVVVFDDQIFIGSSVATSAGVKKAIRKLS